MHEINQNFTGRVLLLYIIQIQNHIDFYSFLPPYLWWFLSSWSIFFTQAICLSVLTVKHTTKLKPTGQNSVRTYQVSDRMRFVKAKTKEYWHGWFTEWMLPWKESPPIETAVDTPTVWCSWNWLCFIWKCWCKNARMRGFKGQ